MTIGLITRPATTADVPALAALVNSAYRGDSSKAGWTTEADLLDGQRVDAEGLTEIIARPGNVILLHERDHAPVACVHLERMRDDCYLGMLTTRPTTQGAGLGRQMLEAAERWATEHWFSRTMHMTVIVQRTELIAWYERRGYRRTGERKPFPYGDERFGLPRRDDLVFEVLRKPLLAGAGEESTTMVSVFVGTSLDGFIARRNGDFDFLPAGGGEPHGYDEFIASVDALVIGRKTFEKVLTLEAWPYGDKRVVVLSSRPLDLAAARGGVVEQLAGPPAEIVSRLAASGARHLYVDGGMTIQRFLQAGLVQRLIITRVPVLIGDGIPLFGNLHRDIRLRHVATEQYASGLVKSEYAVNA